MSVDIKSANIIRSFKILKGNARTSVIFDPVWAIPYTLYNFYLSLYMKSMGITDRQIGFLIAIEFIAGSIISLFSGVIVDSLGREKSTLIFDLICWPGAMLVYLVANSFWMFAFASFLRSFMRITLVSFNLMVVEDSDSEQRVAAFNILNIIIIISGIVTPLAGLLVKKIGIIHAERFLLAFAAVSTFVMMLIRNHYYTETKIGQQILNEQKKSKLSDVIKDAVKNGPYGNVFAVLKEKPDIIMIVCVFILYNIYVPIGTYTSLYYVPYITEVLKIETSTVSILGGINSIMMLIINVFVVPKITRYNKLKNMIWGLGIQAISLCLFILIPVSSFSATVVSVMLFAIGFSIFKPFIDVVLAEFTEGAERSGIYSLSYTIISISSAVMGLISGYIYGLNPRLLYVLSILILSSCIVILALLFKARKKSASI
jgi:MFS family permease